MLTNIRFGSVLDQTEPTYDLASSSEIYARSDKCIILDKIVFDLEGKQLVWAGIQKQLDIHQEFLIGLSKYLIDH